MKRLTTVVAISTALFVLMANAALAAVFDVESGEGSATKQEVQSALTLKGKNAPKGKDKLTNADWLSVEFGYAEDGMVAVCQHKNGERIHKSSKRTSAVDSVAVDSEGRFAGNSEQVKGWNLLGYSGDWTVVNPNYKCPGYKGSEDDPWQPMLEWVPGSGENGALTASLGTASGVIWTP